MKDNLVSFFIYQGFIPFYQGFIPPGAPETQDHPIPFDMILYKVWGNIGVSALDGDLANSRVDVGIDVIRKSDGYTLARFRDDHYTNPTGMYPTSRVWKEEPEVILHAGDVVQTITYANSFSVVSSSPLPPLPSVGAAIELYGRRI